MYEREQKERRIITTAITYSDAINLLGYFYVQLYVFIKNNLRIRVYDVIM